MAGGQLEELFAVNGGVKMPVEVFQRFEGAKVGGFGAPGQHALVADVEFILKDEFEELAMAEAAGRGFLQAQVQGLHQAGEAQLTKGSLELSHGFWFGLRFSGSSMR